MAVPNSRIDIRISNPEKDVWSSVADAHGLTLTQLIKQSVRSTVQSYQSNVHAFAGSEPTRGYYPPLSTTANSANVTYNWRPVPDELDDDAA